MTSGRELSTAAVRSSPYLLAQLAGLLTVTWFTSFSQESSSDLSNFFSPQAVFQVNADDYPDPPFRWTTDGKTQAALNDGLTELKEGSVPRSVLLLEKALQLDSTFWPTRYYYAIALKMTGDLEKAQKQFRTLIKQKKDVAEIYFEYGRLCQQSGNTREAKDAYQESLEINKSFAKAYYALGTLAAIDSDLGKARKNFERCINLNPASAEGYFGLAMLKLWRTRQTKDIDLTYFNKSFAADSLYRPALFWRGLIQADQKNYEACLRDWNRLLIFGKNPFLLNMRGYLYIQMERYEDAYADFRGAILLERAADNRYLTGKTAIDQWVDLQNALEYIGRKGYGLKDQTFFNIRKGVCLMVIGQSFQALTSLNESLREEPSAAGYLLKAILYEKNFQYDSAQSCYSKALLYDNDMFDAHKKKALYYVELRDWRAAYREFNEMKRINPEATVTYRISGMLKSEFLDFYGCIIDLARVLKEDTTDLDAWRARALCRSKVNDHKGALDDIMHCIRVEPDNRKFLATLFQIQMASGDSLAAVSTLRNVSDKSPNDCELILVIADLLLNTKSYDQASFMANLTLKKLGERTCDQQFVWGLRQRAHAFFILGMALVQQEKFEEGLKRINESLDVILDPDRQYQRFLLLLRLGRMTQALKDLRSLRDANYEKAEPYYAQYLK